MPRSLTLDAFELHAEVFGDELAAGEDGNVFHHRLTTIAKARGFHGADLQGTAQTVHHEGGQSFTFDVFSHDQQRFVASGHDLLEDGLDVLHVADLLLVQQHVGVFVFGDLTVGVGHKVRREVTLVELHAFDHLKSCLDGASFLNGDSAVLADLVHCVGDDFADGGFPVGGHSGDLFDLRLAGDLLGDLGKLSHGDVHGLLHTALDVNRTRAGRYTAKAFAIDGLGEHGGGGGSVAGHVAGFAGGLADHLRAHIFKRAFQFDLLGHGDTIFGGGGGAEFFIDEHVAGLWGRV